jgi:hypothetical protein
MRFTGTSSVSLPGVPAFSFALTRIRLSDTGAVTFSFSDTGVNSFGFTFASGFIQTDKILGTYNTTEESSIFGYFSGNSLSYTVNDIYNQRETTFTKLKNLTVSAGSTTATADVLVKSTPINYQVSFSPSYKYYGGLTGLIVSDVGFSTKPPILTFYNSNKALLTGYANGISAASGMTQITFGDVDNDFSEYTNQFNVSIPTVFGDIGGKFSSERTGVSNAPVLSLSDASDNIYYQTSEFDGFWSGSRFTYIDNVLTYNVNFSYSNASSVGDGYASNLILAFQPITPKHGSGYSSQYVTGVNVTANGIYSGAPAFSGANYYFVTGVQNAIESFLFSSGCANSLNVSFSGGASSSGASGALILKTITISGIYNTGLQKYKMVSGYSGKSVGSGYQYAPTFSVATGGACYSLPDYSGVNLYQFTRATGYGAVYAQAAGLTGLVVMSGSGVSGVQVTNIGFGYSSSLPPTLKFVRVAGDTGVKDATGIFGYKTSGIYDFNNFWKASYSMGVGGDGFMDISGYIGGYSGNYPVLGAGNVQVQLICSGLDNTSPVSGMLTVILSGSNGLSLTGQRIVSQSRTFNTDTGALTTPPAPSYSFHPLPDLNYSFDQDQFDSQYISDAGQKIDNIINF